MTLQELAEFIAKTIDQTEHLPTGLTIEADGEVDIVRRGERGQVARFDFTVNGELMFKVEITQYPYGASAYR